MSTVAESPTGRVDEVARLVSVRRMLLLSLACSVAVSGVAIVTDEGGVGGDLALAALLLWLVYRFNSRVARGFAFIPAATWAVAFTIGSWFEPDLRSALVTGLLAVLFAGQAIPLVTPVVRDHVQLHRPPERPRRPARLAFERGRFDAPPDERDHHRRV
ncbi:hypothetical protein [Solicola sp. PLA-1-18]|uniref:hypothetical protein n=1 Tax=Solicola sp. PLA-1-18 TaxID=3380532 RepID=UPI003B7E0FE7